MPDFIYTMKGLGKTYPPDFKVFEDIYLSFYYGAKIGVLGGNGAGKSTLLKIMAGLDQSYVGEARLGSGFTVGHLPQEPQLDPSKNVFGNVDEGVAPIRALLTRFDEINAKFGEDMSPEAMEKLLEDQAKVQDAIDAAGAWIWTRSSSTRWTRCGCLLPMPTSANSRAARSAASRCAGCCCSRRTCCCSTSRPTTWTRSRSRGSSSS
jgi:ATPase subunit of ABC transporter with duplicated ATPase domains